MNIGARLILVIWVGSLWTVGYIVAPGLFANLDDPTEAGRLAGVFFHIEAWLTVAAGSLLCLFYVFSRDSLPGWKTPLVIVVLMVVFMTLSEWGVRPLMEAARDAGTGSGTRFAMLHGISMVLYLMTSLAGVVLVIVTRRGDVMTGVSPGAG